jgi:hypothetical protein
VVHLAPSATAQFSAAVTGATQMSVTWSLQEGSAAGSISATGQYQAPSTPGTYHIVATSSADANATGTATAIVNMVGTCSNLPAAGTWENISPVVAVVGDTSGKNFAESIVVDPFDPATVWQGAGSAGIFKSTDCGATWTHVNTGRNGSLLDQGAASSMVVDPVNQGVMYATAFDGPGGLWKSTNGGVDWDQLFPAGSELASVVMGAFVNSVSMDAQDPKHLVVSMHQNCTAPYGPVCEAESTDGGATWKITTVAMAGATGWVPGAGAFILNATTWLFGSYQNGLWLTSDRGATWSNVTAQGAWGATLGKTLVLPFAPNPADGLYYLPDMQGILQSVPGSDGKQWTLLPNSGGRSVGFVIGDNHLYSADQWSANYHLAPVSNPTSWSTLPPPAMLPADQGAPYLAYDKAHHILYSANFAGGLWRVATP